MAFWICIGIIALLIIRWFISLYTPPPPVEQSDEQIEAEQDDERHIKKLDKELEKKYQVGEPNAYKDDEYELPF